MPFYGLRVSETYRKINEIIIEENKPRTKKEAPVIKSIIKFEPKMYSSPNFVLIFDKNAFIEKYEIKDAANTDREIDLKIRKIFRLQDLVRSSNMVLFNSKSKIQKYSTISEIIEEWYALRKHCYSKRIMHQIEQLELKLVQISNRYRFVKEIVEETLLINRRPKIDIETELEEKKYDKIKNGERLSYDYLLTMPIHSLTKEKLEELEMEMENTETTLDQLSSTSVFDIWLSELKELLVELNKPREE